MILADTSVWVDFFADRATRGVDRLAEAIVDQDIVMGDLILVELLQGAKTAATQGTIARKLARMRCEVLCGPDLAPKAAANYRALRQRGITIRGTIDIIIATWCLETGATLLHNDRDFDTIEEHLGLVVWR